MHKICYTISFISCLYMFRAHVLIIRRSKLHYTASGIITLPYRWPSRARVERGLLIVKQILCIKLAKYRDKYTEMHGQQKSKFLENFPFKTVHHMKFESVQESIMNNTIFASRTVICFEITVQLTHLVIQTDTSACSEVMTVDHYRRTNALAVPSSNMHLGLKPLSLFSVQKNDCQLPVFLFTTHTRPVDFRALRQPLI